MKKRELVKSGIAGLDRMLAGGFSRGASITLSGPTGCGKSTLAMEFLINGAEIYGEKGLYIALEESRDTTFSNFGSYNWDIEKLESEKKLLFLDYPISEVDQFLAKNGAIEELISTMGIERVVVDSMMPIALLFHSEDERQSGFLRLVDAIRKWGTTTLIVSEDTAATTPDVMPRTKHGMESLTEGWIHMYSLYDGHGGRVRALEVLKMKGVAHMSKIAPLRITSDGIVVSVEGKEDVPEAEKPGHPGKAEKPNKAEKPAEKEKPVRKKLAFEDI